MAASSSLAATSGDADIPGGPLPKPADELPPGKVPFGLGTCAGSATCVAVWVLLFHSHSVRPSSRRSLSPDGTGTATRMCCASRYQMLTLRPLVSTAAGPLPSVAGVGSAGNPRFEVCWIVAVSGPSARAFAPAPSASNCAALRRGSDRADGAPATAA